jgi:hypothetical protein
VLVAPSEIEEALHRQYHTLASARPAPLATPEPMSEPAASDGLPPPPSDPGFDGTGLPEDLEVDPDALSGGDVDFDSRGLEPAADAAGPDAEEHDWAAESDLGSGDDLDVDLGVDSDLDLAPEADPEPPAPDLDRGPDSLDDSLADFAPELAADAPGPAPVFRQPLPQAVGPEPVSRDAILRALTQLLVEKGLIDREELIARVHRENGGGS